MKSLFSTGVLLVSASLLLFGSEAGELDWRWIYLSQPLKWERPEGAPRSAKKLAAARILVFEPKGSFAAISCMVYVTPDQKVAPILSEGYTLSSGNWQTERNRVLVRHRTIYATIRQLGERNAKHEEEVFEYSPAKESGRLAAWLRSRGAKFVPLRNLSEPDQLAKVIAFHRQEVAGSK